MLLLFLAACAPREGDVPGDCDDGEDQDGDLLVDCVDADCADSPLCDLPADADADTDVDADTDADTDRPCEVEIDSTIPVNGAVDAYYRGPIEVHFSDPDPTATVSADFPGTLSRSDDRETVLFTPNAPLAPSTAYTVHIHYCGGDVDLSFTTSALGSTPVPGYDDAVGRAWRFDGGGARIVEPSGIGSVFASYLATDALVGVTAYEPGRIDLLVAAWDDGGGQDLSVNTRAVTADFTDAPYFETAPFQGMAGVAGYAVPLHDIVVSGTFAPDLSYVGGVTIAGVVDTRTLSPLLDDSGDPYAICDLAVSFGDVCVPCPDEEVLCLGFLVDEGIAGEERVRVEEVTSGTSCTTGAGAVPFAGLGLLLVGRRQRRREG